MPRGTSHVLDGLLVVDRRGGLELRIDGGGAWRLDADGHATTFVGRRVRIEGVRSGFDLLDVSSITDLGA